MGKLQMVCKNLKTVFTCMRKGERIGGVKIGTKQVLFPSSKIKGFFALADSKGFGANELVEDLSATKAQKYVDLLGELSPDLKNATTSIHGQKKRFWYFDTNHVNSHIYVKGSKNEYLAQVVEDLQNPIRHALQDLI